MYIIKELPASDRNELPGNSALWQQVARSSSLPSLIAGSLLALGTLDATADVQESFASDPAELGWLTVGDTNLFRWNPNAQAIDVTWDSSRPNSYFALPLGTTLSRKDSFTVAFDILLDTAISGNDPEMPNPFQLAVGLVNLNRATQTNFMRGTGYTSPDLVEFSFFPDPGGAWQWGPSLMATMVDSSGANWSSGGFASTGLEVNEVYRVTLAFSAIDQVLSASITRNGQPYREIPNATLDAKFTDLSVDHFAICSYSGAGQDPSYSGSIHAVGQIDNVTITLPELPLDRISSHYSGSTAEIAFQTRTSWTYTVERSTDLTVWQRIGDPVAGDGKAMKVSDPQAPDHLAYYRVVATR